MKIHLVKKGETLFHIAKKYGIELQKLISFNSQLADPDQIDVGMKIKIPSTGAAVPPPVGAITHKHVVVQGDSLWKLAKAWDIPLKAVIDANPHLKNPNVLMTGDIVYIPKLGTETPHEAGSVAAEATAEQPQVIEMAEAAEEVTEALPVNEEAPEWTGMVEHAVKEEVEAEEMKQPMVTEHEEAEFPFAQYQMPAMEAMSPYSLQPSYAASFPHDKGLEQPEMQSFPYAYGSAQPQSYSYPFAQSMEQAQPLPAHYPWSFDNVMPAQQMPASQHDHAFPYMNAMPVAPVMQMPVSEQKSTGHAKSSGVMGEVSDWNPGYPSAPSPAVQMPMYAQPSYTYPQMSGGPCLPCQGYGSYPSGMYGFPYAMPDAESRGAYSPHASWAKKEDCGCGDERTGDIGLASVRGGEAVQAEKPREAKVSINTKTRAPKRKQPSAKQEKKHNRPWIRA
ncbi:LysM peptidoglycan-binding domain-containing protein [Paenibacillus mesophilus]|uniref:LysM peptidoglycan-binding domain-containing protein n=1 Tax=Paenibacillus mesophilus TaxID=2582849 RepID=UPI0013051899|nr:LysM peptidoglycan-binding domain-containing protein [Paenibacillus mesophilus]